MILNPSIIVNALSGTAKEVTARVTNNRQVVSQKARHSKHHYTKQIIRKLTFATITKAYQNLTAAQHQGWADLAEQSHGKSVFGQKAKLSAFNVFVRLNANLALVKKPIITEAPQLVEIPSVSYKDIWVTTEQVIIDEVYPLTLDTSPTSEFVLVVKISPGQKKSCSNAWNKTSIFSTLPPSEKGEMNLTQAFQDKFQKPPTIASKYFFEFYWLDITTGITGQSTKISGLVQENSWINSKPFSEILTVDKSVLSITGGTFEGELNYSPNGPLMSGCLDIEYPEIKGTVNGILTDYPIETVRGNFYAVMRSSAETGRYMVTPWARFNEPNTLNISLYGPPHRDKWKVLVNTKL